MTRRAAVGAIKRATFTGESRTTTAHASTTDPQAMLYRKSPGERSKLCYMGHAVSENRHGLVVEVQVTEANGFAASDPPRSR